MYEIAVFTTLILVVVAGISYIRLMWRREIEPTPSTWILLMVMLTLSFWMFWEGVRGLDLPLLDKLKQNLSLSVNVPNISVILMAVVLTNIRYGTLKIAFDKVQKWCLIAGAFSVVLWSFTSNPLLSYILLQLIGVAAYAATAIRLWHAEQTTEPYFFWISSCLSNLCTLYPAWVGEPGVALYAWIFLARAIPSNLLLIFLIWRLKKKMRIA